MIFSPVSLLCTLCCIGVHSAEVLAMAMAAVAEDLMETDSDAVGDDADPTAVEAAESDPSAAAAAAEGQGNADSSDGEQYSFGDTADTDEDEGER